MTKPQRPTFQIPENIELYYKALRAYYYWKACNKVGRGLKPTQEEYAGEEVQVSTN